MSMIAALLGELEHEASITRRVLERAPEDKFDWKPHEKSMTMGRLAAHLAETPQWLPVILKQSVFEMDPSTYKPFEVASQAELMEAFDSNIEAAKQVLQASSDQELGEIWRMKIGEEVKYEMPRLAVVRGFVFNHLVHHRGQLSVYLRLNEIPVPSIYGPSADEEG